MSHNQDRELSRRNFLKGLAVGGGAIASTAMLSGCSKDVGVTSELPEKWDYEADLVVLGLGAGGMTAAAWAAKDGVSVIALEKGKSVMESSSAVSAWEFVTAGTSTQKEKGIDDSSEKFLKYFKDNSPEGFQKYDMIEVFLPTSLMLYEWLLSLGVECAGIKTWPGMDQPRLHTLGAAKPIAALLDQCQKNGVQILFETPGKKLIVKDDRVVGVEAEYQGMAVNVKAKKGVLLANGGFEGNPEMLYAYHGYLPSIRKPAGTQNNTGDGFKMAWALGAATEDAWIAPPPAVAFASAKGTAYGFYHAGGILVNKNGQRFVNESETHTVEANALAVQPEGIAYVISDSVQRNDPIADITWKRQESQNGACFQADTLEDLAAQIGVDPTVLVETVNRYNSLVDAGVDEDFGRDHVLVANEKSALLKIETGPFYSFAVMAANFPTEMGLVIDPNSRVYDVWGNPILGLYATGLMGNIGIKYPPEPRTLPAITGAMVFGYQAAKHVATLTPWDA